jgi:phosphoserine phosphatase
MPSIITLIGTRPRLLRGEDFTEMESLLGSKQIRVEKSDELAHHEAQDFYVTGDVAALAWVKDWAFEKKIDVVVQPQSSARRKKALIADMESTIIQQEMLDEMASFAGIREHVEDITRRAMNGELDFRAALAERLKLLKGLDAQIIQHLCDKITYVPGAKDLLRTLRGHGVYCALVSGGFRAFTSHVAKELRFDEEQGNVLGVKDGKLSGEIVEPVLDKNSKLAALKEVAQKKGITAEDICAVGDGANDLPMLLAAGLGVAYHAKPAVQEQAKFTIRFADLRALLYAQGYRAEDIRK